MTSEEFETKKFFRLSILGDIAYATYNFHVREFNYRDPEKYFWTSKEVRYLREQFDDYCFSRVFLRKNGENYMIVNWVPFYSLDGHIFAVAQIKAWLDSAEEA